MSWYATPEELSSHWYTYYKSLLGIRDRTDVRVLCREDLVGFENFIPVLPKTGFRRSFFLSGQRKLDRCLREIEQKLPSNGRGDIFFSYEGGVRELQTFSGLAKAFPDADFILNFYNVSQWEEAVNRSAPVLRLLEEAQRDGVKFTTEFSGQIPIEITSRLTKISDLPLFSSITPRDDCPDLFENNILVVFKSFDDIKRHETDLSVLADGGWNLRIQAEKDYLLPNGTVLQSTGPLRHGDSYRNTLSKNIVTVFLYNPTEFARKTSGKLEDVIAVKSIPIVPGGSSLEVQNGRQLRTFDWNQKGSLVEVIKNLGPNFDRNEQPSSAENFLKFLEEMANADVTREIPTARPIRSRRGKGVRIIDRGNLGDFLSAVLVWTGSGKLLKTTRKVVSR